MRSGHPTVWPFIVQILGLVGEKRSENEDRKKQVFLLSFLCACWSVISAVSE